MATMFIERSGGCRRRASTGGGGDGADVIEPWFMLSRSVYQSILDVALADMTSAEVLQRACSSSSRGSELLRLLSTNDDVTTQLSLKPRNDDPRKVSAVDHHTLTGGDACDKPGADVRVRSSGVRLVDRDSKQGHMDTLSPKCLRVPLAANQMPSAGQCRPRSTRESSTDKGHAKRLTGTYATTSSQPLCLCVPSYSRSRSKRAAQSGRRRRPATDTCRHVTSENVDDQNSDVTDDTSHSQSSSLKPHVDKDPESVNNVRPPSLTASEPLERSQEQRQVEILEFDESKYTKSDQMSPKDLTRKRKSLRQPEVEIVRVDASEGDGWAPIDKDVLVGIVERLSVSSLQPSSSPSSSLLGVHTEGAVNTSTVTSLSEFRQPQTLMTAPPRRRESSGRTGVNGGDVAVTRDVLKRSALPAPPPLLMLPLSSGRTDPALPHKTQRLRTTSPAQIARSGGRRKSSFQRHVHVRDTWNVPADKTVCRVNRKASTSAGTSAVRQLVDESVSTPRHVWAPLEKSVVLNVIDHILVDSDVDETTTDDTNRRCEQSSRRRWLQPPPLRVITTSSSARTCSDAATSCLDDPVTTAAEASFKWKSNILLRMRKEQTVNATSSSRWLDLSSEAVAATGS